MSVGGSHGRPGENLPLLNEAWVAFLFPGEEMTLGLAFWIVVVVVYAVLTGTALFLAFRLPRTRAAKIAAAAVVVAIFGAFPAVTVQRSLAQERAETAARAEQQKYREAAWAHFQRRCKEHAGEQIHKTVDHVDSLLLLKPRGQASDAELRDQHWRGDPYGHDSILPDSEIRNFVAYLDERDIATFRETSRPGYPYLETKSVLYGYRRYQLDQTGSKIIEVQIEKPVSRYAVTWEDISTEEDRKYWVAGGLLQVLDLRTNEVLGQRIGYLIEPGFGSDGGGRRPWLHARLTSSDRAACPPFRSQSLVPINRLFVEKVLKPGRKN